MSSALNPQQRSALNAASASRYGLGRSRMFTVLLSPASAACASSRAAPRAARAASPSSRPHRRPRRARSPAPGRRACGPRGRRRSRHVLLLQHASLRAQELARVRDLDADLRERHRDDLRAHDREHVQYAERRKALRHGAVSGGVYELPGEVELVLRREHVVLLQDEQRQRRDVLVAQALARRQVGARYPWFHAIVPSVDDPFEFLPRQQSGQVGSRAVPYSVTPREVGWIVAITLAAGLFELWRRIR